MDDKIRPAILCVDDDPLVLSAEEKFFAKDYKVTTAPSAEEGLVCVELDGPFDVIVTDMNMPGMDGVTFLSKARVGAPDTTRVLLTGEHDLKMAIRAVNEGNVFRFLTKPCPLNVLLETVAAAAAQHRLISAERVLLEETLHGSVEALTNVLALASPLAFSRALRAKNYAGELATQFAVKERWQVDVAAMLSQIGCITLPATTLEKLYGGKALTDSENEAIEQLPEVARQLLGRIPRLESVVQALVYQGKHFDGAGHPKDTVRGEAIPWAARVLKIVLDYDVLETAGLDPSLAISTLKGRSGWYDPTILEAFAKQRGNSTSRPDVCDLSVHQLRSGMTFAADVRTRSGALLIGRGQEVSESLLRRLHNLAEMSSVVEPVRVFDGLVPTNGSTASSGT